MTEAEQGILGCILLDNGSMYKVYEKLKPDMFSTEITRDCYKEMLSMYDMGDNINAVNLSQRLESRKWEPEDIGTFLKQCVLSSATSAMIKSYSDTVIKSYKSRVTKDLFQRLSILPCDIDNSISEALTRLEELQGNIQVRSKSLKQIVLENKGNYFNEDVGKNLVKTGFYKWDDILGGLEGGDVTVIGARPAVGKSAIVAQMIAQMAKNGHRVGYFNFEMNENQVYERFLSRESELSLTRVRRAKAFLGNEKESFDKANNELEKYDVIVSTGNNTISQVRAESRHQNLDIIIIDYLQLIKPDRFYGNRVNEVGDISKAVKSLARELHVPIILLSQLNRSVEHRDNGEPTLADLRESGDIEQDASNVVFIWNLSDSDRKYKGISFAKNRMGELGKIGMTFDGEHMKFEESMDDFNKFVSYVKSMEKGNGFESADDCPFK